MGGRIRDADVALVRERSPIADVVAEHVQLRPAGRNELVGLCPFHDEKSPSFYVNAATGLFHCFGCQQGGDVYSFVREIDGLTFREAAERLARRAGVALTYEGGGTTDRTVSSQRQRLLETHRAAAEFYAEQLESQASARAGWDFLAARGFDLTTAARFEVGYAPTGWDTLTRHLLARRFTGEELVLGGLAKQGARGGLIDRFHHRLMWPIRDLAGEVVGFGGRRLAEDDAPNAGPKYLNTPDTPLFKKANLLYGADLARRDIARRYQVVVVEGYTDVMACHLAGVTTAVATCGTAFGSEHVAVVRRLLMDSDERRGEVIFTFDGDAAGQKAALRAFEHEERFATQTFVAVEPSGRDPCELWMSGGDGAVRDLVASRVPLVEFAIRGVLDRYDLNTTEGRLAALDAAAPLVNRLKDAALRHRYAVNLDRWLGFLDERFVVGRVAEHRSRQGGERAGARSAPMRRRGAGADDAAVIVEREALKLAVQYPGLAGPMFDTLGPEMFTVPAHRAVRDLIAEAGGVCAGLARSGEVTTWVTELAAAASEEELRRFVTALAVERVLCDHDVDDRYVDEQMSRVQELHVTRRITDLKSRVQRLNGVTDAEALRRAFGELIALEQHKHQLRERGVGAA
ncbi:DNA primase [Frankia casuarinae]|uniref:DNA primase n=1 Tax=Frankia casuarinae (strain DSM 45818 / CECT 9043 / HFP020203 / CcI3) TaxID=106370 RepID=Q2JDI2_FRACC|nr:MULTISPECIES: DNA primase [Frankia]ABD10660.1 DNA primase [Frankia casuarinae]EYT93415.1 DNA primase [Frankia casuarinae]KDA43534.1 DNA primase [Frankia sp. BMG5.23]ORT53903.1 DNA primase [Frankia sp. KB5]TFE34310.1 DNA primase [Frankia sp. B2]